MKQVEKPQISFAKYQCPDCLSIISSSYSGEFVSCTCGKCFVDQTKYYTRVGGNAVYMEENE